MNNEKMLKLKSYYREFFPAGLIYNKLKLSNRREVAFCKDSTFLRHLSFDSAALFRKSILESNISRIELGGLYDDIPSKYNTSNLVGKELVFDVDLTDYERKCCDGKKICVECYEIVKCAIKLLDYILRKEFGFKEIGFVFSGRRGVHCWVFDYLELKDHVRHAIFTYFDSVIKKDIFVKEYNEIMMEFTNENKNINKKYFLRLDKQVTVNKKHLIKIPFSVHPDTMNISIPLDPNNITEFKDLPTVDKIFKNPLIFEEYKDIFKKWRL